MAIKGVAKGIHRRLALTALAAALGWGGNAVAASSLPTDCDRSAKSFLSSSAHDAELTISAVDLSDTDTQIGSKRKLDNAGAEDASLAPLLYLAPRVESILDDVFESESERLDVLEATETSLMPIADRTESTRSASDDAAVPSQERLDAPPSLCCEFNERCTAPIFDRARRSLPLSGSANCRFPNSSHRGYPRLRERRVRPG